MIYLLTAIGLSPGGSSTVHIYIKTIHRTTQNKQCIEQHNNLGECGPCPVLARFTLAFASQLRKKHGKISVRMKAVRKELGERSRYSDWAYRLKDPEFDSRQDEFHLFFETSAPVVGSILPPIQRVSRILSPRRRVKPTGLSVYYLPPAPSSVDIKNDCSYNPTSRVCRHGVGRGILTFLIL